MIGVPSTEPLNALLVEDNPGDAALMTARLQLAGGPSGSPVRLLHAESVAAARASLQQTPVDVVVLDLSLPDASSLTVAQRVVPDIVVLDLDMPGMDGLTALRELGLVVPRVRALILTVHAERERLVSLLEAGARGYLSKEAASRDLVEAIRVVAAGEVYVRPTAA